MPPGTILWQTKVFRQDGKSPVFTARIAMLPDALTDGKRLYVHFV